MLLKAGNGGQQVSFDGGGDEPGPEPTDAIFTNNFDKQIATQTDGKWPYADEFDVGLTFILDSVERSLTA